MGMSNFINWLLRRKEEKQEYPYEFALISLTESAKGNYINDEMNKIILHYRGGKLINKVPFSEEEIRNFREIDEIPVIEEELSNEADIYQEQNFGEVINLK